MNDLQDLMKTEKHPRSLTKSMFFSSSRFVVEFTLKSKAGLGLRQRGGGKIEVDINPPWPCLSETHMIFYLTFTYYISV